MRLVAVTARSIGAAAQYDRCVSKGELAVQVRAPAALAARIGEKLDAAEEAGVERRLRAGDATLWGPQGHPRSRTGSAG